MWLLICVGGSTGSDPGRSVGTLLGARGSPETVGAIGTREYMAPEQWEGSALVDCRTDVFAFGVCMYEMLTGRRPYEMALGSRQDAPEPGAIRGDGALPERLCHLLQRCVAWEADKRPKDFVEIRKDLAATYELAFGTASPFAEVRQASMEADGHNNRGVSYLALDRPLDAIRCFEGALRIDPLHPEATYNCGIVLWRQGNLTDEELITGCSCLSGTTLPDGVRGIY